jgi:hypothetical protein
MRANEHTWSYERIARTEMQQKNEILSYESVINNNNNNYENVINKISSNESVLNNKDI